MITGATQTKGVGGFYSFFGIDQKCAGEGLDHYVFDQRIGQLSSQQFWQKLRQLSFLFVCNLFGKFELSLGKIHYASLSWLAIAF